MRNDSLTILSAKDKQLLLKVLKIAEEVLGSISGPHAERLAPPWVAVPTVSLPKPLTISVL